MWKENIDQPFEILIREREVFPVDVHQHSFYEMVYVISGTGRLAAFGEEVTYRANSLFLIWPETAHRFVIDSLSRFVFMRFTQDAISDYVGKPVEPFLMMQREPHPVTPGSRDARKIRALFHLIWQEKEQEGAFSHELLLQWSASVLLIASRHLAAKALPANDAPPTDRIAWILPYIQRHISQPERLTTQALSETFHFSRHYLGRYFRRHFQENLGQYINLCRMKAVENELVDTLSSIKEIAWKYGFADASHLTKAFRRHTGKTPSQFRKEVLLRLQNREPDGQGQDTEHGCQENGS